MPTYAFDCKRCGHHFERFAAVKDRNGCFTCPKCKSRDTRRIISGSIGLIFKGPGFYVNDYPKEKT